MSTGDIAELWFRRGVCQGAFQTETWCAIETVKPTRISIVSVGALLLMAGSLRADGTNPYDSIWRRNSFALTAPPLVVVIPPIIERPVTSYVLTGIASVVSPTRAMFVSREPGGKTDNFTLAVGERYGALEVLAIDDADAWVRVKKGDDELQMSLETDGMRPVHSPIAAVALQGARLTPVPGIGPAPMANHLQPDGRPITPEARAALPGAVRRNTEPVHLLPSRNEIMDQRPAGQPITVQEAETLIELNRVMQPKDYPPLPE
jgi:hypothetical protein